jgi:hypothetical protein
VLSCCYGMWEGIALSSEVESYFLLSKVTWLIKFPTVERLYSNYFPSKIRSASSVAFHKPPSYRSISKLFPVRVFKNGKVFALCN